MSLLHPRPANFLAAVFGCAAWQTLFSDLPGPPASPSFSPLRSREASSAQPCSVGIRLVPSDLPEDQRAGLYYRDTHQMPWLQLVSYQPSSGLTTAPTDLPTHPLRLPTFQSLHSPSPNSVLCIPITTTRLSLRRSRGCLCLSLQGSPPCSETRILKRSPLLSHRHRWKREASPGQPRGDS